MRMLERQMIKFWRDELEVVPICNWSPASICSDYVDYIGYELNIQGLKDSQNGSDSMGNVKKKKNIHWV